MTETCESTGKRIYLAWTHAERDAAALRRKGDRAHTYHCKTGCHKFHVGRHVKTTAKRKRTDR